MRKINLKYFWKDYIKRFSDVKNDYFSNHTGKSSKVAIGKGRMRSKLSTMRKLLVDDGILGVKTDPQDSLCQVVVPSKIYDCGLAFSCTKNNTQNSVNMWLAQLFTPQTPLFQAFSIILLLPPFSGIIFKVSPGFRGCSWRCVIPSG